MADFQVFGNPALGNAQVSLRYVLNWAHGVVELYRDGVRVRLPVVYVFDPKDIASPQRFHILVSAGKPVANRDLHLLTEDGHGIKIELKCDQKV